MTTKKPGKKVFSGGSGRRFGGSFNGSSEHPSPDTPLPGLNEPTNARQTLQEINEILQSRVAERTWELEQANEELIAVKTMFYTLFNSNPIPTALNKLDDWVFLRVNQAYLDYFHVKEEQVIGRSAAEFGFAPDAKLRARMRKQLKENGQIPHVELSVTAPNGEPRTVFASLQCIHAEGEDRVISAFMDITERVKAEKQVQALASELTMAEQAERHRISRLLHDELQQRLFAIRMQLSFLQENEGEGQSVNKSSQLTNLESWLSEAIEMTRDLSVELSPLILEGEGLVEAVNWLSTQMEEKYDLKVDLQAQEITGRLEASTRILLYQAVRELLFNVVKHSETREAKVILEQTGGRLRIRISDHGKGFNAQTVLAGKLTAHGLVEIQKKVTMLGCSMDIESSPGNGTQVTIEAPISPAEEK